jgi:HAD superfamily hydrolase (TIGR01484 family)
MNVDPPRLHGSMRPLSEWPKATRHAVGYVLLDIDDTLTTDGRLTAAAYVALEKLSERGLRVIPVTGRPAGWCDLIARVWPVDSVVGENGAFWFRYDRGRRTMTRHFWLAEPERAIGRERLDRLGCEILAAVPGARIAADQPYRIADLAIDYAEDTRPLSPEDVDCVVALMRAAGATAKVSSIHVNGWFGNWDKLAMTRRLFTEHYGIELDSERKAVAFIGDSPNDEPMFGFFANSVAVANIRPFVSRLHDPPTYVTEHEAGAGFVEFAEALLS